MEDDPCPFRQVEVPINSNQLQLNRKGEEKRLIFLDDLSIDDTISGLSGS